VVFAIQLMVKKHAFVVKEDLENILENFVSCIFIMVRQKFQLAKIKFVDRMVCILFVQIK
jgi:hypothetical protein